MTTTAFSDAELLAQARQGDEAAFTELYVRHQGAARRLAASYPRAGDPDDLVNAAFERVLGALRRGGGPDQAFRAYLFVTLRRLAADQVARAHDEPVNEVPEPVRAEEQSQPLDPADRQMVVAAYESLPERWQAVLWQTAVEGRRPRELAGVLGMSANAAAAMAYRAREKLRQAYLQAHLQAAPRPQCEPHRSRLGAYVRDGLSQRDRSATDAHLDGCGACRALVAELVDVNRMLVRSLFPLFTSTAGQVGAAATAAGAGLTEGALAVGKRLASKARANPSVLAGAAVMAALALALISMRGDDESALPVETPEAAPDAPDAVPPSSPPPTEPPSDEPTPSDPPRRVQPAPPRPAPPQTTTTLPAPPPELPVPAPVPAPVVPAPPPVPGPPPVPTTTTTTVPAPPVQGPVVWVPSASQLRIMLTNPGDTWSNPTFIDVYLDGGAVVSDVPSGCALSVVVIWTAKCAVLPLDPGETKVVTIPLRTHDHHEQAAYTTICRSGLLALDCLVNPPRVITTRIEG